MTNIVILNTNIPLFSINWPRGGTRSGGMIINLSIQEHERRESNMYISTRLLVCGKVYYIALYVVLGLFAHCLG